MSEQRPITTTVDGGVATITLSSPGNANSMTPEWGRCLRADVAELTASAGLKVVVLRAEGKAFCVGGDIRSFAEADDTRALLWSLAADLHESILRLRALDAPLVASVQGVAAGAGLSLVLAADLAIAGRSAFFSTAYTAAGLSPDGGMSWTLPRIVGRRRAAELLLTNRRVRAEEAAEIGLVTETVDDDQLEARTAEVVAALAKGSPASFGATRRLLDSAATTTFEQQLSLEAATIARLGAAPGGQEGLNAFLEKRAAVFPE